MGDGINGKMSQLPSSGGTLLMYFLHGPSDGPSGIAPQLPTVVSSSLAFVGFSHLFGFSSFPVSFSPFPHFCFLGLFLRETTCTHTLLSDFALGRNAAKTALVTDVLWRVNNAGL